jgi:FkbM family methyltransferase
LYRWPDATRKFGVAGTISPRMIENPINYSSSRYEEVFFYNYKPKHGDIIIDAGSGAGEHLDYLSYLVGGSGLVIAVEADPELYELSKILVLKLGLDNVRLVNAALFSESDLDIILHKQPDWVESSVNSKFLENKDSISVSVKTTTIDKLLKDFNLKKIDFIKMNIEGAEADAVLGCKDSLSKIKNWCISTHDFAEIFTQKQVESFFIKNNLEYFFYPKVDGLYQPWLEGYLFSNSIDKA